jgi:DNA-binding NarL/FixJ family response regulator
MIRGEGPAVIRILCVDDHLLIREGIAAVLDTQPDMELVGTAANGREAIDAYRKLQPDVTLMDLRMPDMDGIRAISLLRAEFPDARVIVLTTYPGDAQALGSLRAGALGYLLKTGLDAELFEAIRAVQAGKRYLPAEIAAELGRHAADDTLSAREVEVLRRVAAGQSNKRIARELGISENTVKAHIRSILPKLEASDRTHAVTIAIKRGIFDL